MFSIVIIMAVAGWATGKIILVVGAGIILVGISIATSIALSRNLVLLKQKRYELDRNSNALSASQWENRRLLAEIDQRMKSNLQTIIGLTNFLQRRISRGVDEPLPALHNLQRRLGAMACVQRVLGSRYDAISISAEALFDEIVAQNKADAVYVKDVSVKAGGVLLEANLAGPVGLIFHEMFEQASQNCYIRHACTINITAENIEDRQRLTLNAAGKIDDLIAKMNVDALSGEIITMLSEQIDAEFDFVSQVEFARWRLTYQRSI